MHLAPKHQRRLATLLRATPRQCVALALDGHLVGARVDAASGDADVSWINFGSQGHARAVLREFELRGPHRPERLQHALNEAAQGVDAARRHATRRKGLRWW